MTRGNLAAVPLCLMLAACGGRDATPSVDPRAAAPTDWRRVATPADRDRLRDWRTAFLAGLAAARAGDPAGLRAEGPLLTIDRTLAAPVPPPGDYRCRVVKLGPRVPRGLIAYPPFTCRIDAEGDVASFHKIGGSQRPVGLIFDDPSGRAVFLGTLMLGDERRAIDYGRDRARDLAGFVERIGERRWRITFPYPAFESTLDVVELVPAR